jgi:RNA polymerase sigma-70 factor (ECF subfamily)
LNRDEEINYIKDLRNDKDAAFDVIFEYYFPRLMNFASEYVRDKEVAREIVQDTFLKLWEIRKKLDPQTRLASLLYTITRNDALNYLKQLIHKQKYINDRKRFYQNQLNYIALRDESSEKLMFNELNNRIQTAMNSLTQKSREVFVLSRFNGLKYREIAEKLDISIKTVETHMSVALKHLRKELKDYQ